MAIRRAWTKRNRPSEILPAAVCQPGNQKEGVAGKTSVESARHALTNSSVRVAEESIYLIIRI